jgi:membrane-bound serine protease (ClpP class)
MLTIAIAGLLSSASAADSPASNADEAIDGRPWVELIKIDGSINPAVAHFLEDSIASAQIGGARALIVELDTPGGLMSSAERIIKDLFAAPVPVIVYVAPTGASAASAGTFITQAASLAAMAPGTNIGAAHPVTESGGDVKGDLGTKVENFAAMLARNTARQRGRNEDWAEKAVRQSVMIGDREALESKVVEIVATNIPDLLKQADGRTVDVGGHKVTLQLRTPWCASVR